MKNLIIILFLILGNISFSQINKDSIKLEIVKDLTREFIQAKENNPSIKEKQALEQFKWEDSHIDSLILDLQEAGFTKNAEVSKQLLEKVNYNQSEDKILQDVNKYTKNKISEDKIIKIIRDHGVVVQPNNNEPVVIENTIQKIEYKIPLYIWIIVALLSLIILALGFLLYKLNGIKQKRESELSKLENKNKDLDDKLLEQRKGYEARIKKLQKQKKDFEEQIDCLIKKEAKPEEPEGPNEIIFDNIQNKIPENKPKIKYAPKLIEDGWSSLSSSPNSQTLYKLIEKDSGVYEFEVYEELTNFVKNEVANFPDTALYNACITRNSNREFNNYINTLEKGVIEKQGDLYVVKEKAVIKFE